MTALTGSRRSNDDRLRDRTASEGRRLERMRLPR